MLRGHLDHEEAEGLTLIDATVTQEQWQAFGTDGGKRIAGAPTRCEPARSPSRQPHPGGTNSSQTER